MQNLIKREIEKVLLSNMFDKEMFSNLMYKLIFSFKVVNDDPLNQKVLSAVKEAISIMITSTFKANVNKDINFRMRLMETFATFWKIYATYELFESLEGDLGYDKRIIRYIFNDRIDFYINDLTDYFYAFRKSWEG